MNQTDNPFAPGAGTQPPEMTGRSANLQRARTTLERIQAGRPDRSSMLVGLRGVGKTVLLNRIQQMAESAGYEAVLIESPEDKTLPELLVPALRQILIRLDRRAGVKEKLRSAMGALRAFASVFKVKVGDIGVEVTPPGIADSGDFDLDLVDLLVAVAGAAKEAGSAVAILIDELQYVNEKELGALFAGIHRVGQLNLPLVVFGAGLPQLAGLSGKAKSYAERLFEFETVGPLGTEDAKKAIVEPLEREGVSISTPGMELILQETEGYPYFLQEWGSHAWRCADSSPISASDIRNATENAVAALDQGFFRVRFDRLTPSEKEYLRAMAELGKGPHRSGDIASKLQRTVEQAAPIRAGIIAKGMIYAPAHGDTAFTVPKFDEYMRRVMPEFVPHPPKKRA